MKPFEVEEVLKPTAIFRGGAIIFRRRKEGSWRRWGSGSCEGVREGSRKWRSACRCGKTYAFPLSVREKC